MLPFHLLRRLPRARSVNIVSGAASPSGRFRKDFASWQADIIKASESLSSDASKSDPTTRLLETFDDSVLGRALSSQLEISKKNKKSRAAANASKAADDLVSKSTHDPFLSLPHTPAVIKKRAKKSSSLIDSATLNPTEFVYTKLDEGTGLPPKLNHGLDRVLFSPGPVFLKDPRTETFNFDDSLQTIPPPDSFDYSKLPPYIIASEDKVLHSIATKYNCKYFGSTSSLTPILSKLILSFTGLRPGTMLESMLCEDKKDFKRFFNNDDSSSDVGIASSKYGYSSAEDMVLRAQFDCHHPSLPNKVFDIKTRATMAIRHNMGDHQSSVGYRIRKLNGIYESFEREYYDMLKSTFLKYSLQVRIGNMDGIFVGYHNTVSMYGFQYIPIEQMDEDLFGNSTFAQSSFALSLKLLRRIMDAATKKFPETDIRILFDDSKDQSMTCIVQPAASPIQATEGVVIDAADAVTSTPSPWDTTNATRFEITVNSVINGVDIESMPFVNQGADDIWELKYSITDIGMTPTALLRLESKVSKPVAPSANLEYFMTQMRMNSTIEDEDNKA
ncbi:hypothetical protein BASA50_008452 [Batrachochytrium salamandrivorans]|uniref:Uncharacterized protein n=1 Tax=Batrachochytrium salamandrivorans TaxID=1357716 RepID=A0ABQ8F578_9FUNG|nr:hypothetical protein BASA60_000121 [Batrachochytrium salamandrivorans]KAH6573219.1 hypothetical protein BASA62_003066 [Batrachochytrium salamandrivorans]KAH6591853.1 hypothetical protein BASA50_008452 [Batrachochytrium salamandrivorans]